MTTSKPAPSGPAAARNFRRAVSRAVSRLARSIQGLRWRETRTPAGAPGAASTSRARASGSEVSAPFSSRKGSRKAPASALGRDPKSVTVGSPSRLIKISVRGEPWPAAALKARCRGCLQPHPPLSLQPNNRLKTLGWAAIASDKQPGLDVLAQLEITYRQRRIARLLFENHQCRDDVHAGVDHRRELAGEDLERLRLDTFSYLLPAPSRWAPSLISVMRSASRPRERSCSSAEAESEAATSPSSSMPWALIALYEKVATDQPPLVGIVVAGAAAVVVPPAPAACVISTVVRRRSLITSNRTREPGTRQ